MIINNNIKKRQRQEVIERRLIFLHSEILRYVDRFHYHSMKYLDFLNNQLAYKGSYNAFTKTIDGIEMSEMFRRFFWCLGLPKCVHCNNIAHEVSHHTHYLFKTKQIAWVIKYSNKGSNLAFYIIPLCKSCHSYYNTLTNRHQIKIFYNQCRDNIIELLDVENPYLTQGEHRAISINYR